jgi:hypothetical protein
MDRALTFNLFDQHRQSVYCDGEFIGWLCTHPGQMSPFLFSRNGYAFHGDTAEEAIEKWYAAGCPKG